MTYYFKINLYSYILNLYKSKSNIFFFLCLAWKDRHLIRGTANKIAAFLHSFIYLMSLPPMQDTYDFGPAFPDSYHPLLTLLSIHRKKKYTCFRDFKIKACDSQDFNHIFSFTKKKLFHYYYIILDKILSVLTRYYFIY